MLRRRRKRRSSAPPELEITAFMNLMVILVPFLLITAVFSRITILDLYLPPDAETQNTQKPEFQLEVTVRQTRIDVQETSSQFARSFPVKANGFNIEEFSKTIEGIKASFSDKRDAAIMADADVSYDLLVKVMDRVRVREIVQKGKTDFVELFPNISIGDAEQGKE